MRNVVVLAAGFYGIRRAAKFWMDEADGHHPRATHRPFHSVYEKQHVGGRAHHILELADCFRSGIGRFVYSLYKSVAGGWYFKRLSFFGADLKSWRFQRVPSGKTSCFNHVVRHLLCEFFPRLTTVQLAEVYLRSWVWSQDFGIRSTELDTLEFGRQSSILFVSFAGGTNTYLFINAVSSIIRLLWTPLARRHVVPVGWRYIVHPFVPWTSQLLLTQAVFAGMAHFLWVSTLW